MSSTFEAFLAEEFTKVRHRIASEYRREKEEAFNASFNSSRTVDDEEDLLESERPSIQISEVGDNGALSQKSRLRAEELFIVHHASYNCNRTAEDEEEEEERPSIQVSEITDDAKYFHAPSSPTESAPMLPSASPEGTLTSILPNSVYGGSESDNPSKLRRSQTTSTAVEFSSKKSKRSTTSSKHTTFRTVGQGISAISRTSSGKTPRRSTKPGKLSGALFDTPFEPHDVWLGDGEDDTVDDKVKRYKSGLDTPKHVRSRMLGLHKKTATSGDLWVNFSSRANSTSRSSLLLSSRTNHSGLQHFVSDPSSVRRLWWDILGVALIGYDLITIPLTFFDIPDTIWLTIPQIMCLLFWVCDIPASFFVGFHANGMLEMDLKTIAKRYLKTYFCMDVLLVLVDLFTIVLGFVRIDDSESNEPTGIARVAKSWRILRILRSFRLIRLLKLPKTFEHLMERVQSDSLMIILGILKQVIGILLLNHYLACLWYGIGNWSSGGNTWIDHFSVAEKDDVELYMTCLHWSLTQFTPAAMEMYPTNLAERTFTVIVIVFALVTFSSFVSSITNAMTFLRTMNQEQAKNFSLLQRFLVSKEISVSLCVRIRRHLEFKVRMHQQSVQEKDVYLLQLLTSALRIDLHYEVHQRLFKHHNFFTRYDFTFNRCVKKICFHAIDSLHVSDHDLIFTRGDEARKFYVLTQGTIVYKNVKDENIEVFEDMWFSEPVLWTHWVHHGRAKAHGECMLLALDSAKFQLCARENLAALRAPSHYATLFVEHLNSLNFEDLTDLRDDGFDMEWAIDVAFTELANGSFDASNSEASNGVASPCHFHVARSKSK